MSSETSRWSTATKPYDQILALTQANINDTFQTFWKMHKADPIDGSPLEIINMRNLNGHVAATLAAPNITVNVSSDDQTVTFRMNFLDGEMTLNDQDSDPPAVAFRASLAGCYIGFMVEVRKDRLEKDSKAQYDPKIVAKLESVFGADAWDNYSFSQLFLDLTNVDLAHPVDDLSHMPVPPDTVNVNYDWFIGAWFNKVMKTSGHVINYHASLVNKDQNANFAPTSLYLQTYPYLETPTSGRGPSDSNCMTYCQMVDHDPEPVNFDLPWTGNLVEKDRKGTLMLSRDKFWGNWLLPKLQELNYVSFLSEPWCHNSGIEGSENWDWRWKVGPDAISHWPNATPPDPDKKYLFSGYVWNPKDKDGFWWNPGETMWDDNHGISGSRVEQYLKRKYRSAIILKGRLLTRAVNTANDISWTPGENSFTVSGDSWSTAMCSTSARGTGHSEIHMRWSYKFVMESIDSGGLQITINVMQAPVVTYHEDSGGDMSPPNGVGHDLENNVKGTIVTAINDLEPKIAAELSGSNRFVIAANGTFDMSNATFNHGGDLLVDLTYKPDAL